MPEVEEKEAPYNYKLTIQSNGSQENKAIALTLRLLVYQNPWIFSWLRCFLFFVCPHKLEEN